MEDRAGDILTILSRKEKYQELDDYTNDIKVLIGEVMYQYGAMDGINYHRIIRKIRQQGCIIDPRPFKSNPPKGMSYPR